VPRHLDADLRVTLECSRRLVQDGAGVGADRRRIVVEVHTLELEGARQRAAAHVDLVAPGRVRALVQPVDDAVAVAVRLAALGVDPGAGRRAGAAVLVVGYAVTIAVLGRRGCHNGRRLGHDRFRAGGAQQSLAGAANGALEFISRRAPGLAGGIRGVIKTAFLCLGTGYA